MQYGHDFKVNVGIDIISSRPDSRKSDDPWTLAIATSNGVWNDKTGRTRLQEAKLLGLKSSFILFCRTEPIATAKLLMPLAYQLRRLRRPEWQ